MQHGRGRTALARGARTPAGIARLAMDHCDVLEVEVRVHLALAVLQVVARDAIVRSPGVILARLALVLRDLVRHGRAPMAAALLYDGRVGVRAERKHRVAQCGPTAIHVRGYIACLREVVPAHAVLVAAAPIAKSLGLTDVVRISVAPEACPAAREVVKARSGSRWRRRRPRWRRRRRRR